VHALLGGMVRDHCECYNTSGIIPAIKPGMGIPRARPTPPSKPATGAFRMGAAVDLRAGSTYNTRERLNQVLKDCQEAREGGGRERRFLHRFPPAVRPFRGHSAAAS